MAHLITDLSVGGAQSMLARLLPALDERDITSTVITLKRTSSSSSTPLPSLATTPHCLNLSKSLRDVAAPFHLMRLLRQYKPQVIQTWLYHADLLGILTSIGVPGARTIWNIRSSNTGSLYTSSRGRLLMRSLCSLSRFPSSVVANSHAGILVHARLGYRPKQWAYIPNGLDNSWFEIFEGAHARLRQEMNLGPETKLVGLVGRYDPLKDHTSFLKSARRITQAVGKDVHFVLAGHRVDNTNRQLVSEIDSLGLSRNVHLLGIRNDLSYINQGLDVATCASIGEGFPNTLLEALASGTPCVSTDVGDARSIVDRFGLVVPPKSPEEFADATIRLLQMNPAELQSLGMAARDRVQSEFRITDIARRYEELYRETARH